MDPAATGQQVPKGSTVKLTVVEQPPQVAVPNVQGQDFEQAKATLEGLGLRVKEEKYNPFSNTVQEQTPNSGNVDVGTEIVLKIW